MNPIDFKFNEKTVDLLNGSMNLEEYTSAIKDGTIPDRHNINGDYEFQEEYPTHPLSITNKARRMEAADWIRDVVLSNPELFMPHRLKFLHQALFDCCTAVREAMIVTLAYLKNRESLRFLKKLQKLEQPENTMSEYISRAIDVIEGKCEFKETWPLNDWLKSARIET